MKKRYRILSLALLSACLIGCADEAKAGIPANRSSGTDFPTVYADFALNLLSECRNTQGGDTMISPLSVMTALAMTANGADGDTLAQIETMLCGKLDIEQLNQELSSFYASLSSTESASLDAANSIWLTSLPFFTVNPDFVKRLESSYGVEMREIDFSKSKDAADAINDWCSEKTKGMIPKIANADSFDASTVITLLNALCFDAKWMEPYENYQCRNGVFHGTNGDSDVTMLYHTQKSGYLKGERETGFIKYYEGCKYAFVALLPDNEGDISGYLDSLSGSYLLNLIKNPDEGSYDLSTVLPAFKQETSLELTEILKKMGMTNAFAGNANFSRLGSADDGFSIDSVIHKTFIEVNNAGTRAAAVAAVEMTSGGMSSGPDRRERVVLDRPFIYAIIDTATSLPIFIGSCENVE